MKKKINVLIVDDHLLFREGLAGLLLKSKLIGKIFQASKLNEVIEQISNEVIDIIFMDIRIPENDGIMITREVTRFNKCIKIIALTMLDDKASIVQMFNAGAVGFLTKSTDSHQLFEAINEVLCGRRFISKDLPSEFLDAVELNRRQTTDSFIFTKRELQVLKLISQGYSNKEVAKILGVSIKYIEAIKSKLFDKTGATNSAGLVKFVFETNLVNRL